MIMQPDSRLPADATVIEAGDELPPGSSHEQRDAERVMLDLLSEQLGRELNPATLSAPSGERVEVDGADTARSVWSSAGRTRDRPSRRSVTRFWPTLSS